MLFWLTSQPFNHVKEKEMEWLLCSFWFHLHLKNWGFAKASVHALWNCSLQCKFEAICKNTSTTDMFKTNHFDFQATFLKLGFISVEKPMLMVEVTKSTKLCSHYCRRAYQSMCIRNAYIYSQKWRKKEVWISAATKYYYSQTNCWFEFRYFKKFYLTYEG